MLMFCEIYFFIMVLVWFSMLLYLFILIKFNVKTYMIDEF